MHEPAIAGLRSAAVFGGPLRKAMHSFKYNGLRDLSVPLGGILADGYARYAPPADLLIPVPLHRARQRQRGFNQSLLLAQELSAHTGLPLVRDALVRWRDTRSQVELGAAQRRENVSAAFAWKGASLNGRHPLLIDDVCTTGSTLEACAAPLYAAGAATVWGLTLAREQFAAAEQERQPN
jgi:ComF family protein